AAGSPPASRSCAALRPLRGAFGDLDPDRRLLLGIQAGWGASLPFPRPGTACATPGGRAASSVRTAAG
ncbi:MAG: hypothetical protein ACP5VR_11895, partial [Acidimicrobiales bacterium]